jgi:hypothetical protein
MVREWRNIEIGRHKLGAYIAAGGEVDMDDDRSVQAKLPQTGDARFL